MLTATICFLKLWNFKSRCVSCKQAWDLDISYIGDDRDIVVDTGQISDPSPYLDLLFSLNTTPGNSNGQS